MSYTQGTWNTGEQIRDHKLACSVINLHGTADEVFDERSLLQLQRFTSDVSIENRDAILRDAEYEDESGVKIGTKALGAGDLACWIIARFGNDDSALDERDWELLRGWFERGMPMGEQVKR